MKCFSTAASVAIYVLFLLLNWLQIWYLRRSSFQAARDLNTQKQSRSTSVIERIFTNHMTTLSLVASLNDNLPDWMQLPMKVTVDIGMMYTAYNPIDCLLPRLTDLYFTRLLYLFLVDMSEKDQIIKRPLHRNANCLFLYRSTWHSSGLIRFLRVSFIRKICDAVLYSQ